MWTAVVLNQILIALTGCPKNLAELSPPSVFERQAIEVFTEVGLHAVAQHMKELIDHEIFPTDAFDYYIDPLSGLPLFIDDGHYISARNAEDLDEEISELAYWLRPENAFDFLFGGHEGRHAVPKELEALAHKLAKEVGDYYRKKWNIKEKGEPRLAFF